MKIELTGQLRVEGRVVLVLRDERGVARQAFFGKNLITTAGKQLMAQLLRGETVAVPSHVAVGTDVTAPVIGNTVLGGELARVAVTSVSRLVNKVTYSGSFLPGAGTGTIEEIGLFNAAAAGVMLSRFLTGTFTKGANDTLDFTWQIELS